MGSKQYHQKNMINQRRVNDALLFLNFVKKVREKPDDILVESKGAISSINSKKYQCIYCGCTYVYKKSLVSHMDRLHNVRFK